MAAAAARPLVGIEAASAAEREELFTAWRRFLERLAAARPSVLVFEDLHWADAALLAFLEHLAEWSQGVPLLVVCTARPELYERRPGWGAGQRNAHTINLSPLSDQETAELVSHLASTTVLSRELERRSSSGPAATRSTRRSSCACSPTAASSTGRSRSRSRRCPRACRR